MNPRGRTAKMDYVRNEIMLIENDARARRTFLSRVNYIVRP